MHYNLDVVDEELTEEPALVSMVHYSLEMLQKAEHSNGFLLFVEGTVSCGYEMIHLFTY